jgi:hypothetical protein
MPGRYHLLPAARRVRLPRGDSGRALAKATIPRHHWQYRPTPSQRSSSGTTAMPYPAAVDTRVLQENTGRQAAVLNVVRRARAALDRYREKVTTARVTARASSAITKPTPIHPPTLCRCVVCGRQSRWIDPFPPIPRSGGRGRRPKQYVFT